MLCSAVSSALGSLCNKEAAKKMGPVTLCGWQLILGAVLLIGVGFFIWRENFDFGSTCHRLAAAFVFSVLIGSSLFPMDCFVKI